MQNLESYIHPSYINELSISFISSILPIHFFILQVLKKKVLDKLTFPLNRLEPNINTIADPTAVKPHVNNVPRKACSTLFSPRIIFILSYLKLEEK